MRIKCPSCQGLLHVGQPKAGAYRPTCTHCQSTFVVQITSDDPPQVRVQLDRPAKQRPPKAADKAPAIEGSPIDRGDAPGRANLAQQRNGQQKEEADIPEWLGGYRILRLIGRGAMGTVYEAKQVSLDRLVALKTIRDRLAENAGSLARFAREAYAAAQLTHHNIVQIYDFGEDGGQYFFSMEWVRGGPLSALIRDKGALDSNVAAGYTLQAARGLQFAHRHGMVHRDVKPANLLLTDEGVIKVADLGLVKVPDLAEADFDSNAKTISGMVSGSQVTMQGTAVGTPAYMAPEQGIDAAAVDHRADIYSLGCSLYCMLTGHPPFRGDEASKVLDQHANEPFPNLQDSAARIPDALQLILVKSTAKRPDDRYPSLAGMIEDLERFLGVSSDGRFSPSKQQADQWDSISTAYAAATPNDTLLRLAPILWSLACALVTIVTTVMHWSLWAFGPSMFFSSIGTSAMLASHFGESELLRKMREWLSSLRWLDWGLGIAAMVIAVVVIVLSGSWPAILAGVVLGVAAGAAECFGLRLPTQTRRLETRKLAEQFVRNLRIEGVDEQAMRRFIARYSGNAWQVLFEDLFGYDALCVTRDQLAADPTFNASTSNSLRDRLLQRLATKTKANVAARDRDRFVAIEQRGLVSEGVAEVDAKKRAWQIASALMDNAREELPGRPNLTRNAEAQAAHEKRIRVKAMLADARSGRYRKAAEPSETAKRLLSGPIRFLAGCLLVGWFALDGFQSGLFEALKGVDSSNIDLMSLDATIRLPPDPMRPQQQTDFDQRSIHPFSVGLAGILLCMSTIVAGWRMTPFAIVATVIILLGPACGVPDIGPLPAWIVSLIAGVVTYVPGIILGERSQE